MHEWIRKVARYLERIQLPQLDPFGFVSPAERPPFGRLLPLCAAEHLGYDQVLVS